MPELCRFAGMIIKMLYKDNVQHNKPTFMCSMANMKRPLALTGNCWQGLCL